MFESIVVCGPSQPQPLIDCPMAITIDYMVSQNKSFLPPPLLFLYDDRIHIFGRTTRFICKIKKEISPEWEFVKKNTRNIPIF